MLKRLIPFLTINLFLSSAAQALLIPIISWTKASKDPQYTQWLNQAPPAYVWQNDPEIVAEYGRSVFGSTSFCEPSAIGTALYNQKLYRKTAPDLNVPGVDLASKKIDTNQTLRELAIQCKSNPASGTRIDDAFRCIADVYIGSGYNNSEMRFIAHENFDYSEPYSFEIGEQLLPAIPFYRLERRKPTLEDIVNGLKDGYEVIAIATRIKMKNGSWSKVGGHWFNVSGYGLKGSGSGMDLFVTDPTAYAKYFPAGTPPDIAGDRPLFYTIKAEAMTTDANIVRESYAAIRLRGLMIEKLTPDVVLGGLLLLKAKR